MFSTFCKSFHFQSVEPRPWTEFAAPLFGCVDKSESASSTSRHCGILGNSRKVQKDFLKLFLLYTYRQNKPKSDFCSFAVDTCEMETCQEESVSSPSPAVPGIAFAELWIDFRRSFACARYLSVTRCLTIRNSVLPLSASQI